MKKKLHKFVMIVTLMMIYKMTIAQSPCDLNGQGGQPISTAPVPYSGADFHTNTFDWTAPQWNIHLNGYPNSTINNFFSVTGQDYSQFIAKGIIDSDFHPEDGWELIKRDFGYLADGTVNQYSNGGPYLILYNKYSAVLRVIAAFPGIGAQQSISIHLAFIEKKDNNTNPNLTNEVISGLFGNYSAIAQTMSEKSPIKGAYTSARYPGNADLFFFADFQLDYDPCTCLFESALKVSFSLYNEFDLQLSGKSFGVSTTIHEDDASGYSTQKDAYTWLTSVYTDGSTNDGNTEGGLLRYDDLNEFIADASSNAFKNSNTEKLKSDLEEFGKVLSAVGSIVALDFARKAVLSTDKIDADPAAATTDDGASDGEAAKSGLEAIASVVDVFTGLIGNHSEPTASVIYSQMELVGTLKETVPFSDDINFANPGSFGSQNKPEYNNGQPSPLNPTGEFDPDYPIYNEVLGVFAVLNKPIINHFHKSSPAGVRDEYQFSNLDYVVNPAIFDPAKDKINISGSIVFEMNPGIVAIDSYNNVDFAYAYQDDINTISVFMTPFVPLECLQDVIPNFNYEGISNDQPAVRKVYLKLIVGTQYHTVGSHGVPNQTLLIRKYNTTVVEKTQSFDGLSTAETNDSLSIPATNYNSTLSEYAWKNIRIHGNQTVNTGSIVTYTAGENIDVDAETIIQGEFVMQTGYQMACTSPPIASKDKSYITSFCQSVNYKSNQAIARQATSNSFSPSNGSVNNLAGSNSSANTLEIYPNPSKESSTLTYTLADGGQVSLYISDMYGKKVMNLRNLYQASGNYKINIPSEILEEGVYQCTLETGSIVMTKKIVVVK